jgi:hypothetical protein
MNDACVRAAAKQGLAYSRYEEEGEYLVLFVDRQITIKGGQVEFTNSSFDS